MNKKQHQFKKNAALNVKNLLEFLIITDQIKSIIWEAFHTHRRCLQSILHFFVRIRTSICIEHLYNIEGKKYSHPCEIASQIIHLFISMHALKIFFPFENTYTQENQIIVGSDFLSLNYNNHVQIHCLLLKNLGSARPDTFLLDFFLLSSLSMG